MNAIQTSEHLRSIADMLDALNPNADIAFTLLQKQTELEAAKTAMTTEQADFAAKLNEAKGAFDSEDQSINAIGGYKQQLEQALAALAAAPANIEAVQAAEQRATSAEAMTQSTNQMRAELQASLDAANTLIAELQRELAAIKAVTDATPAQ